MDIQMGRTCHPFAVEPRYVYSPICKISRSRSSIVIRHEPKGIGHPYRCEPFQRFPTNPVSVEPWAIHAVTDDTVNSLALHLSTPEGNVTYQMQDLGWAKAIEGSAFGRTAKEIFSNTHLEDAALRSGEYPDQRSWAVDLAPLKPDSHFTYFFVSSNEEISENFFGKKWRDGGLFELGAPQH